ncbi:Receptor-like tyrosine-protein kinase kin-16 [Labeo rohita]|uniref:Receptor-like tyrosine-protein kinase kin-16 n=2 Tax=Labeo rohita TaxID=84645 RepID=A0ABQ8MHK2_LABRO|nr:Receptor-like tyrosine-protein kinase kin-16 [Labeo rohita]
MEDGGRVIVMCSFGRRLIESSFQLSLKSKYNYALKNPQCFSNNVCVFDVKVSSPVFLTCVHQINSDVNRQSVTYTYSPSDFVADPHCLDHHDGGVSSFYVTFFSFIVVGLFIMIVAVIMATLKSKSKSKAKGSKNTGTDNDYTDI